MWNWPFVGRAVTIKAMKSKNVVENPFAAVSSWAEDFQALVRLLKTAEGAESYKKVVIDLLTRDPVAFYERVDEEGLLGQLFPELEDMKGLEQDGSKHAEGDVDRHNRLIVHNLSKLIERPSPALILAAMFHDVEKRSTKGRDPKTGAITFHGHAKEGVKTFQSLTRKWDIPDEAADEASWLIGHHVDLFLPHAKLQEYVSGDNKLISKLFVDSPPEWGSDLLHLMHADALSSWREGSTPGHPITDTYAVEFLSDNLSKIRKRAAEKQWQKERQDRVKVYVSDALKRGTVPKQAGGEGKRYRRTTSCDTIHMRRTIYLIRI
jgi:hypothetical protein